jgi:hypothetical protein
LERQTIGVGYGLATGRLSVRDERGRLKPAPAALLAIGALVVLAALLGALVE